MFSVLSGFMEKKHTASTAEMYTNKEEGQILGLEANSSHLMGTCQKET